MSFLSHGRWARQSRQILCLLLLVSTLGAALHTHLDNGIKAERHCSACVAMHSALPKLADAPVAKHVATSEYFSAEPETRVSRLLVCGLYVRPPPVSSI